MPKRINCSECHKEFIQTNKGCKIVPKPLCPHCNSLEKEFTCKGCKKTFKLKESYLDNCWKCNKDICDFCKYKTVTVKGMDFSFCKEHANYNEKELDEDALNILEEEKQNSEVEE